MAHLEKKARAIKMRREGATYSEIKSNLNVSKSSLSLWLRDIPLSTQRMSEVRDFSAIRIERFRDTMREKRQFRLSKVREKAVAKIGKLTEREVFLAGLFLYWGEGTKTSPARTSIANTDPAVLCFFVHWLSSLGIPKSRLKIKLHLYSDMSVSEETEYWSRTLGISLKNFNKPYIKNSKRTSLSYPQKFVHGTCNVTFGNRDLSELILESIEHLRSEFADTKTV